MRTLTLLVVVCGWMVAAEREAEERAMTDEQKIQGTWQLVSGERHGKAFSADVLKNVTLTFAADVLTTKNKDQTNRAKFKLHPDMTAKGIDLIMEGTVGEGIYALDGDELKILHGEVGDPRPTKFDPKGSPTSTLLVLKRQPSKGE
jgi:uncharacterized protein (TIGR03067 family)